MEIAVPGNDDVVFHLAGNRNTFPAKLNPTSAAAPVFSTGLQRLAGPNPKQMLLFLLSKRFSRNN
ncbi:hypothetical protein CBW18_08125 [Pedobacter sp. AJM]|nr:hypothetical protein CBW18_08125 [Pedobacter sp. AJM]